MRLCDVPRSDRLDELNFELPLAGGDAPVGTVTPSAIGDVLRRHLPAGDPLAGYADRLSDPDLRAAVRGYLTGSIDLALRLDGAFYVVDYKTNWLAAPGEPLTAWHYRPAALAEEMERAHYGLQALLYTVALHRYLRWRLAGYDPATHLGGVLYLFIRGMIGADTPVVDGQPCGVFTWRAPAALVLELDKLLEDGRMSVPELDPFDGRRAVRADGLLEPFNAIGLLAAADVHVAMRLTALAGETDEAIALAAALAVRAPRHGHVFVDLRRIAETRERGQRGRGDRPVRAAVAVAGGLARAAGGEPARRGR